MIHSNANLGVHGQGLLNLSGPGNLIEAQRLIISLFYSINVRWGFSLLIFNFCAIDCYYAFIFSICAARQIISYYLNFKIMSPVSGMLFLSSIYSVTRAFFFFHLNSISISNHQSKEHIQGRELTSYFKKVQVLLYFCASNCIELLGFFVWVSLLKNLSQSFFLTSFI